MTLEEGPGLLWIGILSDDAGDSVLSFFVVGDAVEQINNLEEGLSLGIGLRGNGAFGSRMLEGVDDIVQGRSDDVVGRAVWHGNLGWIPF
jgi:hypothetical protein